MKTCTGCKKLLSLNAFAPNLSRGGYRPRCRECTSDQRRRDRHGLTLVDRWMHATYQDGCAICGRTEPGKKGWVIDHDRSCCSGDVSCQDCRRGVLCQWCNTALGYAFDTPEVLRRMADYLEFGTRIADIESRYTDRSSESVQGLAVGSPTYKTNERTNLEIAYDSQKSLATETCARVQNFDDVEANR